jgi:hypothetical protein
VFFTLSGNFGKTRLVDRRFVPIEPVDSHEEFRMMADLVNTLPPARLREELEERERRAFI